MKRALTLVLFLIVKVHSPAQSTMKEPWLDTARAIIIDPYGDNEVDFDKLVTDKRVAAIIHKASQRFTADKQYYSRKKTAREKGILWGSYHLGMRGDPVKQADFYLVTIENDSTEVMALDLEGLDTMTFMSLKNAELFITRIKQRTGRYPLVYCNNNVLEEISKNYSDTSVFAKCGLWYARYLKELPPINSNVWKGYTLWQFSCEVNCTETGKCWYNVPGTLYDMDVNIYNGTIEELKTNWPDIGSPINLSRGGYEWRNGFDLDGDSLKDQISFSFSEGAHCCYKIFVTLSSTKKTISYPFEMDGGYLMGVDNSQPEQFNIRNVDGDALPEITMKIQSYNGELSKIPKEWQKEYGIKTNFIVIEYENGALRVRDQKK